MWQIDAGLGYHAAAPVPTMAYDPDAPNPPSTDERLSASHERTAAMIGRTIAGNFRINSLIGAGAMGDVYRATQLSLQKDVAIKLLRRELMIDETLRKRFELEAKNASSLNHPNCIQIIDFGRDGDLLFIAMEFLAGVDLSQLLERDWPVSLERTVHIFDQVLAALEEAHEHGIVHRDLKPANVMLVTRRGDPDFVKVCDFGIAKADGAQSSWAEGLTMKGFICGTPEYMSPEQARGDRLDGRSDLYAAGVLLYQMLTREVPFKSTSPVALLSMHLSEMPQPPTLRHVGLDIPAKLEQLVLQAMEKDPNKRPQTAAAFREALRDSVSEFLAYVPALGTGPRSSGAKISHMMAPSSSSLTGAVSPVTPAFPSTVDRLSASKRAPKWTLLLGAAGLLAAGAAILVPAMRTGNVAAPPAAPPVAPVAVVPAAAPAPLPPPLPTPAAEAKPPQAEAVPPAVTALSPVERQQLHRARPKLTHTSSVGKGPAAKVAAPVPAPVANVQAPAPVPAPVVVAAAPAAEPPLKEAQKLMGKGQYAEACARGEDARKQEPKSPEVYRFLGKCYMRAGDPARANENYRKYLELAPSAPDAAFIKSIVK
ncbi:MAG: protein kinase [Deltaproteobacteria bacterium]|nr:protein kinase [Deltaproteobacteria bacterium]